MTKERILKEASFSPKAITYHVVPFVVLMCIIIVGIPLALVVGPILYWYYTAYYRRLRVILTSRDLKVHRGVLNREEKTIPLEKITDLAVYQGPIMRFLDIKGIRIETAGQTSQGGALVSVIGIENTDDFRDRVLNQRDRITESDDESSPESTAPGGEIAATTPGGTSVNGEMLQTMRDMRDALQRIESLLRKQ